MVLLELFLEVGEGKASFSFLLSKVYSYLGLNPLHGLPGGFI